MLGYLYNKSSELKVLESADASTRYHPHRSPAEKDVGALHGALAVGNGVA